MPTPRARMGRWGEELAGRFLKEMGYGILETNYRCPRGEVDIVAREGQELVFVEVRTRQSTGFGAPEESLTPSKVRRLLATCQHYVQAHGMDGAEWRIDLVCVCLGAGRKLQQVRHLRHAVQL